MIYFPKKFKFLLILFTIILIFSQNTLLIANYIRDTELEVALNDWSTPIFKAAKINPKEIKIHIISDNSINAFVIDGNNMFLHTGLITKAGSASGVIGVIAHELHHLAQDFELAEYIIPDNIVDYFLSPIEIEAFHVGFRAESAQSNTSIEECIRKYLDNFLSDDRITKKEYENIVVKWLKPEIKLLKGVINNES